jgi:hypothetical protein
MLHRRAGVFVPALMVAVVVMMDVLRFAFGVPKIAWVNLGAVWLFVHQMGFFYADGSLVRIGRSGQATIALAGIVGLVALTNIGVYPRSMIGTDVERISNMNPPTLCIVALTLWQIGLALIVREPIARWLERKRPWMAVIAANGTIMTLFLWHMTAYVIVILLLWPLGLGRAELSTASWWVQRPLWIIVPGIVLAGLVAIFGRFERPRPRAAIDRPLPPSAADQVKRD